jgi:hypothetical protein
VPARVARVVLDGATGLVVRGTTVTGGGTAVFTRGTGWGEGDGSAIGSAIFTCGRGAGGGGVTATSTVGTGCLGGLGTATSTVATGALGGEGTLTSIFVPARAPVTDGEGVTPTVACVTSAARASPAPASAHTASKQPMHARARVEIPPLNCLRAAIPLVVNTQESST